MTRLQSAVPTSIATTGKSTRSRLVGGARWLAAVGLGLALAGCQDTAAPTPTGSMALVLEGLPGGSSGQVRLTRGNVTRTVTASSTLEGLEAGEWILRAEPVIVDGLEYAPQPTSVAVNVQARAVGSARVIWGPTTGSLVIALVDLPAGANPDVLVESAGYSRLASGTLTGTLRVPLLVPGVYTISARDVRVAGSGTYRATTASQTVTVVASAVAATATIAFAPAPATIDVAVSGLPANASSLITLTAPNGSTLPVAGSTRIQPASVGRWRLSAANVQADGLTYAPTPATRDTTVIAGDTLRFSVSYVRVTGALAVAVTGLPQGVTGSVTVTGPAGFTRALVETTTLTDLSPGSYTVRADSVIRNGIIWRPSPATQQVTVAASLTAAPAFVDYIPAIGALVVTISNVPAGATGSVRITGPNGYDRTIDRNTVISPAATGPYTITAASLLVDNVRYNVFPASVIRTVTLGSRDSVDMRYDNLNGSLAVTVTGLPDGANAALTLSGGGQIVTLTGSTIVQNLSPGPYTLTASIVTVGNVAYVADVVTQTLTVTMTTTSAVTVNYRVTNVPIDFAVDRAYLTQATQTNDGTVPLVAGRNALLRVFAHADRSNTLTPTVRARIYDGATLVETLSLTRSGGVPTALNDNVLSSTWNVVVQGASVRVGMSLLVDIDPTNTTVEANESNNTWPQDGSPRSITVFAVPAFTVRFVPVTVKNLTGNVSTGNMESFLTSARLVWPLLNVTASVRAPFTSSADTLKANDSNSGWLTVLSEMNTLRAVDGAPSTMHYYGLVNVAYNSGVAGYGYVPGRAAMGWDKLPSGSEVAAHEWGHNFNRPHAPCGGAAGPDLAFPYSAGNIGVLGWNSTSNTLVNTSTPDIMGYCNPKWISDYNWTQVMTYRQSSGVDMTAVANGDGLLVWGRVVNGKVLLEPAFRVTAPRTAAVAQPTHVVEARDADGTLLVELPITADKVDHVTDHDERQFSVVLPWSASLEQALTDLRIRDIRTPLLSASRSSASAVAAKLTRSARSAQLLAMPDPESVVETASPGRMRVRWNAAQYPMAMVRDAATGQVMGYLRQSGESVVTGGRRLEVVFSDGVRSVRR